MSSAGQTIGAIGGAVAGFFIAGPVGALKGAAYGAAIGGYIDPPPGPNLRGPTLEDKSYQSTAYGVSIPDLYGTIATMGNIIYLENNEYKAVTNKENQGGKGGGSGGTYETTTYYATFAVALSSENRSSTARRIWAGGKLIYSIYPGEDDSSFLNSDWFHYYDGTQTEPDARMEAVLGIGNCPSYSGTAYIIFYDFELTNYGNGLQGCPIKVELCGVEYNSTFGFIRQLKNFMRQDERYYARPMSNFPTATESIAATYGLSGDNQSTYMQQDAGLDATSYGNLSPYILTAMPGAEVDRAAIVFQYSFYSESPLRLHSGVLINGAPHENGYKHYPELNSVESANIMRVYYRDGDVKALFKSTGFPMSSGYEPAADTWFFTAVENSGQIFGEIGFVGADPGVVAWDGVFVFRLWRVSPFNYRAAVIREGYPPDEVDFTLPIDRILTYQYAAKFYRDFVYCAPIESPDFLVGTLPFFFVNPFTGEAHFNWLDCPEMVAVSYPTLNIVNESTFLLGYRSAFYEWGELLYSTRAIAENAPFYVKTICDGVFTKAGIAPENRNFFSIASDLVDGYRVSDPTSGRAALGNLQTAYLFDFVERGYRIHAVKREQRALAPIAVRDENLCSDGGAAIKCTKDDSIGSPSIYELAYLDRAREYDVSVQSAFYPAAFNNLRNVQLAVVMSANAAATLAEKLINLSWIESRKYTLKLPQSFLGVHAGDHLLLSRKNNPQVLLRIDQVAVNVDQTISVSCASASYNVYSLEALGDSGNVPPSIVLAPVGNSSSLLIDIPMVIDAQDSYGFLLISMGGGSNWPGSVLMRTTGVGQNYAGVIGFSGVGSVGQAMNALTAHDGLVMDYASQLRCWPVTDYIPPSVTEEVMMTGKNYIAYGMPGRWEICQFSEAIPQIDGTYILSTLVRGLRGTEWTTGLHQAIDWIIFLDDPDNVWTEADAASIGITRKYKTVTVGQDASQVTSKDFVYNAVNLKPLAPVNPAYARVSNDWIVSATERTRYQSSFWVSGIQPMRDQSIFKMDVIKSGLVVRTIQNTSLSFVYTAAQQTEDFGSVQAAIVFDLYQVGDAGGNGFKLRVAT